MVVDANAVVNPWAMARCVLDGLAYPNSGADLLVMLGNTSIAPFAVLTPQWLSDHAGYAEILSIKLPQTNKLIDDSFLRTKTTELRNESRLVNHCAKVKVPAQRIRCRKCKVTDRER